MFPYSSSCSIHFLIITTVMFFLPILCKCFLACISYGVPHHACVCASICISIFVSNLISVPSPSLTQSASPSPLPSPSPTPFLTTPSPLTPIPSPSSLEFVGPILRLSEVEVGTIAAVIEERLLSRRRVWNGSLDLSPFAPLIVRSY